MLLNVDGLDKRWKKGVASPFEGELGWHAVGDVETYAPLIFRKVRNNLAIDDSIDPSTLVEFQLMISCMVLYLKMKKKRLIEKLLLKYLDLQTKYFVIS